MRRPFRDRVFIVFVYERMWEGDFKFEELWRSF